METLEEARNRIFTELTSDDPEVRAEYLKHFDADTEKFTEAMAQAFMKWRSIDDDVQGSDKRAWVSAQVLMAITLHILSMKLFLSGHIVAAGNIARQVIESIALALVCSGKELGILDRFMKGEYSTNSAVRDVIRHREKLGLNDGVELLKNTQKFYDHYSHPTVMTIATIVSFSEGGTYVGASFDEEKIEAYKGEVNGRVSLARAFPNFIEGIIANVAKW